MPIRARNRMVALGPTPDVPEASSVGARTAYGFLAMTIPSGRNTLESYIYRKLNGMPTEASSNGKRDFVLANTRLIAPPLTPEIRLWLADEAVPIWKKTEDELGAMGLPPPFWAFAWAGGQALARYVLDHPDIVAGRDVLDVASGSGMVAIAAAKAGARRVTASDIDPYAAAAIALNGALNGVSVSVDTRDLL